MDGSRILLVGPTSSTSNKHKKHKKGPRVGVKDPFPTKLHSLLEENLFEDIISWQPHGRCFVVHKPDRFVKEVIPKYFKQSKLESFRRQLNAYGFTRLIGPGNLDEGGYYHELFLRGRNDLSKLILRSLTKKGRSNHEGRHGYSAPALTRDPYYYSEPNFYLMEPSLPNSAVTKISRTRTILAGPTTAEQCFATRDSCGAAATYSRSMLVDINSFREEGRGAISRGKKPTEPAPAEEGFANGAMNGQAFFRDRTCDISSVGDVVGATGLSSLASNSTRTEDSILSRRAEVWYQCLQKPLYDYCDSRRRAVSAGSALNVQHMEESSVAASASTVKTTCGSVNVLDLKSSPSPVLRCGRKDAPQDDCSSSGLDVLALILSHQKSIDQDTLIPQECVDFDKLSESFHHDITRVFE